LSNIPIIQNNFFGLYNTFIEVEQRTSRCYVGVPKLKFGTVDVKRA